MRLLSASSLVLVMLGFVGCHEANLPLDDDAPEDTRGEDTSIADGVVTTDRPDTSDDDLADTGALDAGDTGAPTDSDDTIVPDDTTVEDTTIDDTGVTTIDDTGVTSVEDTGLADTTVEDTAVEDTTVVDTTAEDTTPEDTGALDTTPEDTGVIDTTVEDTMVPDVPDIIVEPPRHPLITELMAKNAATLLDGFGEASDWIEVHNPHAEPLQLAGYRLSDDPILLSKFVFPTLELPPHGFVIVFASDRTAGPVGTSELHAPFKLSGDGEALMLVAPTGEIIQTVRFPRQLTDIAYGLPFEGLPSEHVLEGDNARYRVLAPAATAPAGWRLPSFDDGAWASGPSGFGWVQAVSIAPGPEPSAGYLDDLGTPLADSVTDWSTSGAQGYRGWSYGYWNKTSDGDGSYAASELTQFATNYWTGSAWDWPNGNPPWDYIGQTDVHPNGASNGGEHWPIRRWTSTIAGRLVVAWTLAKTNNSGQGVTGHVIVDGVERDVKAINGSDLTGVLRVLTIDVSVGSTVDFAHDPTSPGGNHSDGFDSSSMTARMWLVAGDSDIVQTPLAPATPGGGILVRHHFDVAPSDDDVLVLGLTADDGAEAWLNGIPLGAVNAAAVDGAPAPTDRPISVTATPSWITTSTAALVTGANVLAVRAYDAAAADGACFVLATLESKAIVIGDRFTWFTAPTPGAPNGPAATTLGPIIGEVTDGATVGDADPIVITATIIETIAPLTNTSLFYRVGFGNEQTLALKDDGVAPDLVAGDAIFTARIPASASAPGEMVRWRFSASDSAGRVTKEPPYPDALDSHQYVGTVINDPTIVSNLPVMHWFLESTSAAETDSGTRGVVFYAGELYDNVRFDLHGQSTRSFPKKSFDFDFTATQRFRMDPAYPRMKDVNLLTDWADKTKFRTTLAYGMLAAAGIDHHLAFPIRVQRNGAFYSVADLVEDGDDRYLERLGRDGDGALYKMYDKCESTSDAEKKTRKFEGKEDLQALIDALDASASALDTWIWDHVDIPGMVGFAASFILVSNRDCCAKNYYAYRDTRGTGDWVYLPWDFDLTFGHNWTTTANYFDDTLYTQNTLWVGDGNKLMTPLFDSNAFRAMVLRRIRTLMDELLQPESTPLELRRMENRIAEIGQQIGADADLDYTEWGSWGNDNTMAEEVARVLSNWFPARRAYLFDKLSATDHTIPGMQPASFGLELPAWDASLANPAQAWIRVHNPNATDLDLSGARVSGDVSFTLRAGTVIVANGDLFIVADVNGFRARTVSPKAGEKRFVQGAWTGTLSASPWIRLQDRDGQILADHQP